MELKNEIINTGAEKLDGILEAKDPQYGTETFTEEYIRPLARTLAFDYATRVADSIELDNFHELQENLGYGGQWIGDEQVSADTVVKYLQPIIEQSGKEISNGDLQLAVIAGLEGVLEDIYDGLGDQHPMQRVHGLGNITAQIAQYDSSGTFLDAFASILSDTYHWDKEKIVGDDALDILFAHFLDKSIDQLKSGYQSGNFIFNQEQNITLTTKNLQTQEGENDIRVYK
jgi:hypothetical protein